MEKNLTSGSVFKTIIYFALPYLLSYFLQTLYGLADLFIIGQFNGVDSITAVTNGSQAMHMLTVIIVGLAMGTTVAIGRAIGANKLEDAAHAIGNTITLFMVVAIAVTCVLLLSVHGIVSLLATPAEAVDGTVQSVLLEFRLLRHIILSVLFSVDWEILKARCISSQLPAWQILHWIIFLSVACLWDRQAQHLERH